MWKSKHQWDILSHHRISHITKNKNNCSHGYMDKGIFTVGTIQTHLAFLVNNMDFLKKSRTLGPFDPVALYGIYPKGSKPKWRKTLLPYVFCNKCPSILIPILDIFWIVLYQMPDVFEYWFNLISTEESSLCLYLFCFLSKVLPHLRKTWYKALINKVLRL